MNLLDLYKENRVFSIGIKQRLTGAKSAVLVGQNLFMSRAMFRLVYDSKASPQDREKVMRCVNVKTISVTQFLGRGTVLEAARN